MLERFESKLSDTATLAITLDRNLKLRSENELAEQGKNDATEAGTVLLVVL